MYALAFYLPEHLRFSYCLYKILLTVDKCATSSSEAQDVQVQSFRQDVAFLDCQRLPLEVISQFGIDSKIAFFQIDLFAQG